MSSRQSGLKVGLEFHQRLDSHKLFCNCDSVLEERPAGEVVRQLRPVAGELGEVDRAAAAEFLKKNTFEYGVFHNSVDLIELDEQPPTLNEEAFEIALEISLLLNCRVPDEVHFMRKTVIDGSAVSGFQRTALVGSSGSYDSPAGRVPVTGVYLEEESAGIVEQGADKTAYRLDRQCIPLVEVATGLLEGMTPAQVRDAALALGMLLRVTGKVQRGLGTIRQDVNVSVPGGARVEIKGVQDVRIIDKIIENEILRQQRLIELKKEAKKRGAHAEEKIRDFSDSFKDTKCGLIKKKGCAYGIILRNFSGLLKSFFGKELAGIARAYGLGGLIHTDEDLEKYGFCGEFEKISRSREDAVIIVAEEKKRAEPALLAIAKRANALGVPEETRRALPDATTEYMRPLPGAQRLYPETDLPPVVVSQARLADIRARLPKHPEKIFEELVEKYELGEELAERLVTSPRRQLFYKACAEGVQPSVAANLLESMLRQLCREGVAAEFFSEQRLLEACRALKKQAFSKEALPEVLRAWAKRPSEPLARVLEEGGFALVGQAEVQRTAKMLVKERAKSFADKQAAFNALMGELMKKYRGKADGALISKVLKKELDLE